MSRFASTGSSTTHTSNAIYSSGGISALSAIYTGQSGERGSINFKNDAGTANWLAGVGGSASDVTFIVYDLIEAQLRMQIDDNGNFLIGGAGFGTNAEKVISFANAAVEPAGSATDAVQLYSVDLSAGNTIPAFYCEGSGVTGAGITSTTVTHKIATKVNGTVYYLLATTNGT